MKLNKYIPLAIATLATVASNTAMGGMEIPTSDSKANPITISLALNSQGKPTISESLNTVTETAVVDKKAIDNVLILKELRDLGVITNISGWKINVVSSLVEGEVVIEDFYITKPGFPPINISDYMNLDGFFFGDTSFLKTYTGKSVTKALVEGDGDPYGETVTEDFLNTSFGIVEIDTSGNTTQVTAPEGFEPEIVEDNSAGVLYFAGVKYKTIITSTTFFGDIPLAPSFNGGPTSATHTLSGFNMSNGTGFGYYGLESFSEENVRHVTGKIVQSGVGVPIFLDFR